MLTFDPTIDLLAHKLYHGSILNLSTFTSGSRFHSLLFPKVAQENQFAKCDSASDHGFAIPPHIMYHTFW